MTATSATDFSKYLPPGVYTEAVKGPQLAVNSSVPTAVGLFGTAVGFRTWVESVKINADTAEDTPAVNRTLTKSGIDTSTIVVHDPNSGQVYAVGTDFTVELVSGTIDTDDATYAIARVIDGGHIQVADTVQVAYQYTDSTYYDPYIFYDYDDVRTAYGDPFDTTTGEVQSELTLAAKFALLNGAHRVVCVAVKPTTPGSPTTGDYGDALDKLRDQELVAIVCSCSGSTQMHALVQQHVDSQSSNRFERRAILGMDGTTVAVASAQRILNAQSITDERVLLVSPATFTYFSPELNNDVILGGQYMAACLAGMTVAMSFAEPLTQKRITGWKAVTELQPEEQKNLESENGLCVIEKSRTQNIRVRHGVTTDTTDLETREWSVIGQKDALTFRLRDYLEAANLIGTPIYDYTLINVKASAEAALQSLYRDQLLLDYTGLKVRQLMSNPDVLEVTFTWKPSWPLNYIVVRFAISLSTGDTTSVGSTANSANLSSAFGGAENTLQST